MTERLLTARELGVLLGLSPATVLDRFERGDLPGFRLFGRKGGPVRFRESEILSALEGWRFGCIELAPNVTVDEVRTEAHSAVVGDITTALTSVSRPWLPRNSSRSLKWMRTTSRRLASRAQAQSNRRVPMVRTP